VEISVVFPYLLIRIQWNSTYLGAG